MLNKLDESLLRPLPPFSKLENGDIRAILDQATHHRFEEGVTVFEEGDKAAHFYLLLDGTIRVVRITLEGEFVTALHIPQVSFSALQRLWDKTDIRQRLWQLPRFWFCPGRPLCGVISFRFMTALRAKPIRRLVVG